MKKKLIYLLVVFIFTKNVNAQFVNEFERGFNTGFKNGYCFDKDISCMPPLTPIAPLPSLSESIYSFKDGYNKGFLVGKSIRDVNNMEQNNIPLNIFKGYKQPVNPVPNDDNVGSVDLNLLQYVLKYKQDLFNSRSNWVQKRIDNLYAIIYSLFFKNNSNKYIEFNNDLNDTVGELNTGYDLSNEYLFSLLAQILSDFEAKIIRAALN